LIIPRLQRIYFYTHVNRQGRFNALDEDSESEEENSKGHLEWEAEQKRLVEEGRRPPLDPTYVMALLVIYWSNP
jgi:hypothetical protein